MGLKDKLKGTLRSLWSPITVWLADQGSDELVTSGAPAKVVVSVQGEDDGTADRVELLLELTGVVTEPPRTWALVEVPAVVGTHELTVDIPTGLPPSCAQYSQYHYSVTLYRTKGLASSAKCKVDVVARPEDLAWPEGPRSGGEGDPGAAMTLSLAHDVVTVGAQVTGRVLGSAPGAVVVVLGTQVQGDRAPKGKFREVVKTRTEEDGTFVLQVPPAAPPSLDTGVSSVAWQVRASRDGATAWHWVGVLDPECLAGSRHEPSPGLLDWLASLDASPGR